MVRKKTPKRSKKRRYSPYIGTILLVIAVAAVAYFFYVQILPHTESAAVVNGEQIPLAELNKQYSRIPDEYAAVVSKEMLLDQLINTRLLVQEAESQGIGVAEDEVEQELDRLKIQFDSQQDFEDFLSENDMDIFEIRQQLRSQLMINKLLEQELLSKIEVSENKIRAFYEQNLEPLNVSYEMVRGQINDSIYQDLANAAIQTYVGQLRAKSDITINPRFVTGEADMPEDILPEDIEDETDQIETFTETGDEICTKGGKPVVRLYTTSGCKSCDELEKAFYDAVGDYDVVVYHWELDTGQNIYTEEMETGIPKSELDIFQKYNPKSTVPTYVMGCRYVRVGAGGSDMEEEKQELSSVISELSE